MKQDISRKQFLTLGLGATAAVLLPGCAADDDTDTGAGTEDPTSTTNPSTTDSATTTNSTTTSPTTTTDPATTDSTSTDPSTTDPVTTDPATTDPMETSSDSGTSEVDSSSGGSTGAAFDCSVDPAVVIGGNHNHALVVTAAEIAAGAEVVYDITGTSLHSHTVTLTPADFATLESDGVVMVQSSNTGHEHPITVTCA